MQAGWLIDWLSSLPAYAIGIVIFVIMAFAAAGGQFVRRLQDRKRGRTLKESGESVAQEGYLLSSVLGLLGLLMAFSFGMVLNRYEARRELVTQEANAIGTAYLRAQLLDEPHRSRLSNLLIEYTQNRIKVVATRDSSSPYLARNDQLLTEIWAAVRGARQSAFAHGVTTALLLTFNEVTDLNTQRKVAWSLRVPGEVVTLLLVYLGVTAAVVGHQVDGPRGRRAALVLFILVALSISVMTDINQPMSGHARDSQEPMRMLLRSLQSQPPEVFDRFDAPGAPAR